jgi:hypothetical protein
VFDFSSGTQVTPGTQRAPADLMLFGTDGAGTAFDDTVCALSLFDCELEPRRFPGAFGFRELWRRRVSAQPSNERDVHTGLFSTSAEVGDNG